MSEFCTNLCNEKGFIHLDCKILCENAKARQLQDQKTHCLLN